MEIRSYSSYATEQAGAIIMADIIRTGRSDGWQGDISTLNRLKELLAKFNIFYTDDMFGRWERV